MKRSLLANFKTYFLLVFLFTLTQSSSAQYVTLDYGTVANDSLPLKGGSDAYSWSYSIYKASEIDSVVAINKLEIRSSNTYSANFHQIKVYLMHTTDSVFNNATFQNPAAMGASLVYKTNFNLPTNNYYNWFGFELIKPFYYNGTDNLMVIWVDSNVYYAGNPSFRCHSTTLNCSKKGSNTNSFPTSGSVTNKRPNIRFTVEKPFHNDLSLDQWDTITTYMPSNSAVGFSFKVSNKTSTPQSNFTVKYSIDNGVSWKSKLISSTLAINTSMTIDFNTTALKANMTTIGEYKCIAVIENPADSNAFNDTIAKNVFVYGNAYSGTYLVGSSAIADFPTPHVAAACLSNGGMGGAVTLKIENGVYPGHVVFANVSGNSTTAPLTIESLSGNPDDVVIKQGIESYGGTLNTHHLFLLQYMDSVKVRNITFSSDSTYGTTFGLFYLVGSKNVLFEGNKVNDFGFSFVGGVYISYGTNRNITIKNNIIESQMTAIKINDNNHNINVIGNDLKSGSAYSHHGVYGYSSDSISIIGNKIRTGHQGIHLENVSGSSSSRNKIINNFISSNLNAGAGIILVNSSYVDVDYNSVLLNGSNVNSRNVQILSNCNNITLRNNNLINRSGGYLIDVGQMSVLTSSSNYNNLYTTGLAFSKIGAGSQSSFTIFKSYFSQPNSINLNVVFVNDSNLHLIGNTLWNTAIPIGGITTDIDGELRDAIPDIGADEHGLYSNNGSVAGLSVPACSGSSLMNTAMVENIGLNAINNLTMGWSINGMPKPNVSWTGNLALGNFISINLGTYPFSFDSTYSLKTWIVSVNNTIDSEPINDTLLYNGFHLRVPASIFQIGSSTSADYANIDSAISLLSTYGVCGPIVINMEDGTYSGNYVIPDIEGLSVNNTLTIQSLNGDSSLVLFEYASVSVSNGYIFKVDSSSNIIFKDLSFRNTGVSSLDIEVYKSLNITFKRCDFKSNFNNGGEDYASLIRYYRSNGGLIDSCSFSECYNGILLKGINVDVTKNIIVSNNTLLFNGEIGIKGRYADSLQLSYNSIVGEGTGLKTALILNATNKKVDIFSNRIDLESTGKVCGIDIDWFNMNSSSLYKARIYNNFMNLKGHIASIPGNSIGVDIVLSSQVEVAFNTIILKDVFGGAALYILGNDNISILNNIFHVDSARIMFKYTTPSFNSNYNSFYSTHLTPYFISNTAYTLSAYRTNTGNDMNSVFTEPFFISPNDYHVSDSTLNNQGTPILGITTDLDGDIRDITNPDIGADEFENFDEDVALLTINSPVFITPIGIQTVRLSIKNHGNNILVSDSLFFQLDNGPITSYAWSGSLNFYDIATNIVVGTVNLVAGNHTLKAWTSTPNNLIELNTSNDTLYKSFVTQSMPGIQLSSYMLNADIQICNDTAIVPLTIKNVGNAPLILTENHASTSWIVNPNLIADTIAVNDSITINYEFSSNLLNEGTYTGNIQITSNDLGNPLLNISSSLISRSIMQNPVNLGLDTSNCGVVKLQAASYPYYEWSDNTHNSFMHAIYSGTYWVFVQNGNCTSSDTINVLVYAPPAVSINGMPGGVICDNLDTITLTGTPVGGVFTGLGIGNTFVPMSLGAGTYPISYIYTDTNNCSNTALLQVSVYTATLANLTGLDTLFCLSGPSDTLIGNPVGGVFSGSGVSQNLFNPSLAGAGQQYAVYSYTNASGCIDSDTMVTMVLSPTNTIVISSYQTDYCLNNSVDTIEALPLGGVFGGDGMNQNILNPSIAGLGSHYLSYHIVDSNLCSVSDSVMFTVHSVPLVSMNSLYANYCQNWGPISLIGQPTGGQFVGIGVSGNSFLTEGLPTGNYTISYVYNLNGCTDSASDTIYLSNASISLGSDTSLCESASLLLSVNNGFTNFQWSTGATTNSILVDSLGVGIGSTHIKLQVTDTLGCNGKDTIVVTFVDCTSLNDMDDTEFIVNIYPNPSNGVFILESNQSSIEGLDMQVLSMSSKILINRNIHSKSGRFKEKIDLSSFAKGVYIIRLSNGKDFKQIEVVLQ